jgi:para-nitrobenzyl esterase
MKIDTAKGVVEGGFDGSVYRFAGIPYAAAPTGPLRFAPPQPVPTWSGVRPALDFGPGSIQPDSSAGRGPVMYESRPTSEDCLTLNVWTPDPGAARLPVLVFIHGGGYLALSGAQSLWHGEAFARAGIVLVTMNYRLGALGYLHLDEPISGVTETSSNGLLDQLAALAWVHDNISRFGGDPDQVTVMGQSAGAWAVNTMLADPAARGLFRRAIIESGGGNHVLSTDAAKRIARRFIELAGLDSDLEALRAAPSERLLAAQMGIQRIVGSCSAETEELLGGDAVELKSFIPVVGTTHVPVRPQDAIERGAGADVDLLAASCQNEYGIYRAIGGVYTEDQIRQNLSNVFARAGRDSRKIEEAYAGNRPNKTSEAIADALGGDRFFRMPTRRIAEAHSSGSARTYVAEFGYGQTEFGAAHCIEQPLVFATGATPLARVYYPAGAPAALVEACHGAWVEFVKTGKPRADWPQYDTVTRPTMVFDMGGAHVELDPGGHERALWEGVL